MEGNLFLVRCFFMPGGIVDMKSVDGTLGETFANPTPMVDVGFWIGFRASPARALRLSASHSRCEGVGQ